MSQPHAGPTTPQTPKITAELRRSAKKVTLNSEKAKFTLVDPRLSRTVSLLGGPKALGKIETTGALVERIRAGLPASSMDALLKAVSTKLPLLTRADLLSTLKIAKRTADRKKAEGALLDAVQSDRLVRIARIAARAEEVLGDIEKATQWLVSPNRGLGAQKPIEMLDTEIGAEQVDDVLTRIEFGVYG
ncbi:DUF2384 domain-containing protein [Myxococcota bacterium]|nr:DUF2384 domain-containing protein [Myxococcota bacterium]